MVKPKSHEGSSLGLSGSSEGQPLGDGIGSAGGNGPHLEFYRGKKKLLKHDLVQIHSSNMCQHSLSVCPQSWPKQVSSRP